MNSRLTSTNGTVAFQVGTTAQGDPSASRKQAKIRTGRKGKGNGNTASSQAPQAAGNIYLKRLPRVVTVPRVPYPAKARRDRVQGTVKLLVTIDRRGRVVNVKILRRLGHGLDQAAASALRRARFQPAMGSDGKPMRYSIRYRYRFQLES